ncbi:hypothetical protein FOZ62_017360 [Perkinsus olseni]|uniref:Uncharacterized protein n=1 Tax=Perkinsus olseni TaxID=32597 RepID=A0A7J6STI2_PEROL|nr:hypothetical protein FOZ62_017360 [Perkinsus olseni]
MQGVVVVAQGVVVVAQGVVVVAQGVVVVAQGVVVVTQGVVVVTQGVVVVVEIVVVVVVLVVAFIGSYVNPTAPLASELELEDVWLATRRRIEGVGFIDGRSQSTRRVFIVTEEDLRIALSGNEDEVQTS